MKASMLLGDTDGLAKPEGRGRPTLISHQDVEDYLGRYAGLMLYLKEMDESVYGKLCAVRIFLGIIYSYNSVLGILLRCKSTS